jgi:hypothetical protein
MSTPTNLVREVTPEEKIKAAASWAMFTLSAAATIFNLSTEWQNRLASWITLAVTAAPAILHLVSVLLPTGVKLFQKNSPVPSQPFLKSALVGKGY